MTGGDKCSIRSFMTEKTHTQITEGVVIPLRQSFFSSSYDPCRHKRRPSSSWTSSLVRHTRFITSLSHVLLRPPNDTSLREFTVWFFESKIYCVLSLINLLSLVNFLKLVPHRQTFLVRPSLYFTSLRKDCSLTHYSLPQRIKSNETKKFIEWGPTNNIRKGDPSSF